MSKTKQTSKSTSKVTSLSKDEVTEGIGEGKYVTVSKEGGNSEVWSKFNVVVDVVNHNASTGYVQCIKCQQLFKHNNASGVTTLKRHTELRCNKKEKKKEVKPGAALKKEVTKCMVQMCATDNRPFNFAAGDGFRNLAQTLVNIGAVHGPTDVGDVIPTPTTLSRNVAAVAGALRKKLIPEVLKAMSEDRATCTSDMWSDKHSCLAYTAVTAHYIENWKIKNVLLLLNDFPVEEKHSGANIIEEIELGLSEIGISPLDLANVKFVTDEGANYIKAMETYDRISCFAHNLNTVLRNTLDKDFLKREAPQTWETIAGNRRAVKYLKKSFKAAQLENAVHGFLKVRFNSLLRNLRSTFDQYVDVVQLLRNSGKVDIANTLSYKTMEELIGFLDPFRQYIESVQSNTQPTSCLVVPAYLALVQHCKPNAEDSEEMTKIRARALQFLQEKVKLRKEHYVATFLVPSLREMNGLDETQKAQVKEWVRDMCKEIQLPSNDANEASVSSSLFKFPGWEQVNHEVDEVQMYEILGIPSRENPDDILGWGKTRESMFPRLAEIAKRVFAIPATSCESERVFSRAGAILTQRRSVTSPEIVGDLVFLAINTSGFPEEFEALASSDEEPDDTENSQ